MSDSDDNAVDGPITKNPRSISSSKRSSAKTLRPDYIPRCYLCGRMDGIIDKKWHGVTFHNQPCYRAMRNRMRMIQHKPDGLTNDVKMFEEDPDTWINEVKPWAFGDPDEKRKAKYDLKQSFEEKVTVSKNLEISTKMKLIKLHFKSWKRQWEEKSGDEASVEFDELYEKQGVGQPRIHASEAWPD